MRILNNLPNPTAPTTERPDGQLKDVSAPAAGDGTPAREDWLNDAYYALLALMDAVGISADDSDEEFEAGTGASQFLSAMRLFSQEWAYPGKDQGLKNISAGNQTTDITAFEAGGGSEKEDGFTVRARWTGGDGSFQHTFITAYTLGSQLTGFLVASKWAGDGQGEIVLRLDKTNSQWIILSPGIWDSDGGSFTDGVFQKNVAGDMVFRNTDTQAVGATGAASKAFNMPVNFLAEPSIGITFKDLGKANTGKLETAYASGAPDTITVSVNLDAAISGNLIIRVFAQGPWA